MSKSVTRTILILTMTALCGCSENPMTSHRGQVPENGNIVVIRKYVDELLNKENLAVADEIIGPNFVDPAGASGEKGPESLKKVIASFRSIFPDLHVTISEVVAGNERVAWHWSARGTHQGEIFGIPPTGKSVTFSGIIIDTLRDGRIVRRGGIWDQAGLKAQLSSR